MIPETFYFGHNGTCFGHYTPSQDFAQGKSVLIVPSIFGEAIRSHWVIREVAKSLAKQGYDVLRFDFDGDGNSCSETHTVSVQDWTRNIQESYDELVARSKTASVSVFAIRFGAGLSLFALEQRPVESFVLWDPLISGEVMYNTFVGPGPSVEACDTQHSDNPFALRPQPNGFFQVGLGKEFSDDFLLMEDVTMPACDVHIIRTEPSSEQLEVFSKSNIRDVNQQCRWLMKDLPVIFSPKLVATICGCF